MSRLHYTESMEGRHIMSFIDSPISRCEAVREMVLTDQTQRQCALEHGCPAWPGMSVGWLFCRDFGRDRSGHTW